MSTVHHPIAVIGGGLGGLTLAAVLHRHGIYAVVYELDASPTARHQGGMLDLHEESGQAALRAAGLFERFQAHVLTDGDAMRILDRHGTVRMRDDGDGSRPEVERGELRDILHGALPDGTVRWDARVAGARPLGGGRHEVTLADGGTFTTDLLVGADGAWSRVRPLVSAAAPAYSGLSFVETHLLDVDRRHPQSAALVGRGSMFALGDGQGLLTHRHGDGQLSVYIAMATPEDWAAGSGVDFGDVAAAKGALLARFDGWDASLRRLIADADGALVPRPISALPVGHRWDRVPGVTLLGDAAHLMSPFAGEGANLAMIDGADLAAAIARHRGDTEAALTAYEQVMFPRSEQMAAESARNLVDCFRPDAPQGLLDAMARYELAVHTGDE